MLERLDFKKQKVSSKTTYQRYFKKHGRYKDTSSRYGGVHIIENENGFYDRMYNKYNNKDHPRVVNKPKICTKVV